jgi:hypothetical protein
VLNVAGHRLGTMEIESALVAHPKVAEAAVVGKPHEIKGESVFAYVVLKGERPTGDRALTFTKALREHVAEQLGAIAKPDDIRFADNLPKTRSGKIMRRLLRAIARNEDITQDLSTLENPAIIEQLRGNEAAEPALAVAPTKPAPVAVKKPPRRKRVAASAAKKENPSKPRRARKARRVVGKAARVARKAAAKPKKKRVQKPRRKTAKKPATPRRKK